MDERDYIALNKSIEMSTEAQELSNWEKKQLVIKETFGKMNQINISNSIIISKQNTSGNTKYTEINVDLNTLQK